jgi:hypothetical protein
MILIIWSLNKTLPQNSKNPKKPQNPKDPVGLRPPHHKASVSPSYGRWLEVSSILQIVELGFEAFALSIIVSANLTFNELGLRKIPYKPISIIFGNNWSAQSQKLKFQINEI